MLLSDCSKIKPSSCKNSDTPASVSATDIQSPPSGLQSYYNGTYTPTKYLKVSANDATLHLFGTSGVSDWMMIQSHEMLKNIVNAISEKKNRTLFNGFQAYVITNSDPVIPNGVSGQRNTGGRYSMVMNEVLVCATAVDTIRPNNAAEYRSWDTPIHEFGHSIQFALDLENFMEELESKNNSSYQSSLKQEYFPFAIQNWFDHQLKGNCGTDSLPEYEKALFTSIFNSKDVWRATCAGR